MVSIFSDVLQQSGPEVADLAARPLASRDSVPCQVLQPDFVVLAQTASPRILRDLLREWPDPDGADFVRSFLSDLDVERAAVPPVVQSGHGDMIITRGQPAASAAGPGALPDRRPRAVVTITRQLAERLRAGAL